MGRRCRRDKPSFSFVTIIQKPPTTKGASSDCEFDIHNTYINVIYVLLATVANIAYIYLYFDTADGYLK